MRTFWFRYSHRPSLYLKEPDKLFHDIRRNAKWAWQRLTRGWDDTMTWDVAVTLSELVPVLIKEMQAHKDGVPADAFPPGSLDNNDGVSDWAMQLGQAEFDRRCNVIIAGFEALNDMIDRDWCNDQAENEKNFAQALLELKRSWNELWW